MTTLGRYGYDGYDDEVTEMHPQVKRQAEAITRRSRLWQLRQWFVASVGVLTLAGLVVGLVLAYLGRLLLVPIPAMACVCGSLYLLSLALRAPSR